MKVLRIILITTLVAICGVLGLFCYQLNTKVESYNNIQGKWYYYEDYSKIAARNAYDYLADSGYKDVTLPDLEERMKDIKIPVTIEFKAIDKSTGTYTVDILKDEYDAMNDNAYEILEECVGDIISNRLMAAELISKDASEEEQNAMIEEMLGADLGDVIKEHGPKLLPFYEDIEKEIKDSGSYKKNEDFIVSTSDADKKDYIVSRIKDKIIVQVQNEENEEVYIYSKDNSASTDNSAS